MLSARSSWSKGEQQRPYSNLARPRQCLWLNTPQADWRSNEALRTTSQNIYRDHQWLFWWIAASILRWRADNTITEVRERNSDWLYHLGSTICNGHEPNHQRRQEGNQRTKDSLRDTPTIQQRVHEWPDHIINYNTRTGPLGTHSIRWHGELGTYEVQTK